MWCCRITRRAGEACKCLEHELAPEELHRLTLLQQLPSHETGAHSQLCLTALLEHWKDAKLETLDFYCLEPWRDPSTAL